MRTSETIGTLSAALAKAQGMMGGAKKDSENKFFESSYADLAAVVEAIKKPFSENELAFAQATDYDETDGVIVVTRLMHSSGEWIEGRLKMRPVKNDPQGVGSTITYARRYALQAMSGVPSEDDDGNAGTQAPKKAQESFATASNPADDARAAAKRSLFNLFAALAEQHPLVMPFGARDTTASGEIARWSLVSQHIGRDIKSFNDLTTDEVKRAISEIRKEFPVTYGGR